MIFSGSAYGSHHIVETEYTKLDTSYQRLCVYICNVKIDPGHGKAATVVNEFELKI